MNRLVASVRTPYLLNLQDDWLLDNSERVSFVKECIGILASDPKLGQVKLDGCHFLNFGDRAVYDGPFQAGGVPFYVQNPGMLWGGFTFPPSLCRTEALLRTGPFREDEPFRRGWAESEYSARFAAAFHSVKSPRMLLFRHIGDETTIGWHDAQAGLAGQHRELQTAVIPPLLPAASPASNVSGNPVEASPAHRATAAPQVVVPASSRRTVACLLTAYRRPRNLNLQIDAVLAQTVKPAEVALWQNCHPEQTFDEKVLNRIPHVRSTNHNWGVWPRFLFCNEFESEFVCVFDDDTIPGPRWLGNCLDTIRTHEGLLGALGVIFVNGFRGQQAKVGWWNPVNQVVEVDIVGHAWFFRRDWLRWFALEPRRGCLTAGEDYHFSVAVQKHLGLGTFVPPHDPQDRSAWGSTNGCLGTDIVALYRQPGEDQRKEDAHNAYLASGWQPLTFRGRLPPIPPTQHGALDPPAQIAVPPAAPISAEQIADIRFEQDFVRDFEKLNLRGKPFAFIRFGDGESALCMGRPVRAGDGWCYDGSDTPLARKMREAVHADIPGLHLGISCRCCDPHGHSWYRDQVRAPLWRVTFANIFVNGNYKRFKTLDLRGTVLVSSSGGDFTIPRNAVNPEFDYSELLKALFDVDSPILVAGGPVAKVLIYDYWRLAPKRQVIMDVGSALDPVIYGRCTRGYHDPNCSTATKICVW